MNGAQIYLFAKLRKVAGSVSGPPARTGLVGLILPYSLTASKYDDRN